MLKENYSSRRLYDYLPNIIVDKGLEFKQHHFNKLETKLWKEKERLQKEGYLVRTIKVLAKNLRGRTAHGGNLYQPHEWLFTYKKPQE